MINHFWKYFLENWKNIDNFFNFQENVSKNGWLTMCTLTKPIKKIDLYESYGLSLRASIADVAKKKCHFDTPKVCFIILPHHFTISHLSDVLSFNSIH